MGLFDMFKKKQAPKVLRRLHQSKYVQRHLPFSFTTIAWKIITKQPTKAALQTEV